MLEIPPISGPEIERGRRFDRSLTQVVTIEAVTEPPMRDSRKLKYHTRQTYIGKVVD